MAHADDATKTWVSAVPTKNSDGNVMEWNCKYSYTLAVGSGKGNVVVSIDENTRVKTYNDDYVHIFNKSVQIDTPSKTPDAYTQAELLTLMDKDHWDDMFNRKYTVYTTPIPVETTDKSFDVSSLSVS